MTLGIKDDHIKNKLCHNKHFSLSWFIMALISNKSMLNIVSLQKNGHSVSNSWGKSLWWWHSLSYGKMRTCINSLDHLFCRRGEMSQWTEIALEWPILFMYLLILTTISYTVLGRVLNIAPWGSCENKPEKYIDSKLWTVIILCLSNYKSVLKCNNLCWYNTGETAGLISYW